jgi:hydrogenase 3 maturation protease
LKLQLKEFLKDHAEKSDRDKCHNDHTHTKILFLGIGNDMLGDDAIGPVTVNRLSELFKGRTDILVINGGTVPENYTGIIRRENPSHLIFIDAVEMGKEPGHIRLVEKDEIANYSISTHAMPISFLIKYLESSVDAQIILIGIQPKNMDMTQSTLKKVISSEVEKSIEEIVETLKSILN